MSPEPRSKAHVLRWELMGGTFDMTSAQLSLVSTLTFGLVGKGGFVSGVSARCWVLRDRMRSSDRGRTSGPLVVSLVGEVRRGTARTLRTTQWTRASCN